MLASIRQCPHLLSHDVFKHRRDLILASDASACPEICYPLRITLSRSESIVLVADERPVCFAEPVEVDVRCFVLKLIKRSIFIICSGLSYCAYASMSCLVSNYSISRHLNRRKTLLAGRPVVKTTTLVSTRVEVPRAYCTDARAAHFLDIIT